MIQIAIQFHTRTALKIFIESDANNVNNISIDVKVLGCYIEPHDILELTDLLRNKYDISSFTVITE